MSEEIEKAVTKNGKTYRLRENFAKCEVVVFENEVEVFSDDEYMVVTQYLRDTYNMTDTELIALYEDYKNDRDGKIKPDGFHPFWRKPAP